MRNSPAGLIAEADPAGLPHFYGITERDSDDHARQKIARRLLALDDAYREVLPVLFEFFGVPDPELPAPHLDPEMKQRQLVGVRRHLEEGGRLSQGQGATMTRQCKMGF